MDYEIIHIPERKRFIAEYDGEVAWVEYVIHHNNFNITHTFVPTAINGRGIAGTLVRMAYTYALEHNMKLQATCPYAVRWLHNNPEFANQ